MEVVKKTLAFVDFAGLGKCDISISNSAKYMQVILFKLQLAEECYFVCVCVYF